MGILALSAAELAFSQTERFDKILPSAVGLAPFQGIIKGKELLINAYVDRMGFFSRGFEDVPLMVGGA
jgi:hypothetical protein